MPLDVRGFQITPDILGAARGGLRLGEEFRQVGAQREARERQEQIRQLLGGIGQEAPQTEQEAQLAAQTAPFADVSEQAAAEQPQILSFEELRQQARQIDPAIANQMFKQIGMDEPSQRAEASRFAAEIQGLPIELQNQRIQKRVQSLQQQGRDATHTAELLPMPPAVRAQAFQNVQLADLATKERLGVRERAARGIEKPAGQVEFEALTKDLTEEQKKEAALIKLGLSPRAVGSAIQTISDKGIADEIGKSSAIIAQRKKFGEMTGASRSKTIDKGFEKLVKIDLGIKNIDRAIEAIDAGASTGVLQQFSPSIRASSVALDQVRNTLALDVLNSATFGALSEKELELVKETALPTKLKPPELKQWLIDRKVAEQKLRAYYQEQINHLDQGGTVASFLRKKERELEQQPATGQTTQQAVPPPPPGFVVEG